jgi:hypothetical protein
MSSQPKLLTVLNQVVHSLIITWTHTHTSDLQQFEIYQDAIEQSNVQIKPLTQCKQTFSPPFGPNQGRSVTSGKIEWANLQVSTDSYFACHALINAGLSKLWKSLEDYVLSKMEPSNAACRAHSSTSSFSTSLT